MMIREANVKDVPEILTIVTQNLIPNKKALSQDQLESEGFLIQAVNEKDLNDYLLEQENYTVLVAESEGQIVGYAISCTIAMLKPELQAKLISCLTLDKVLYYKNIAKRPGHKGVGKPLLKALIDNTLQKGYKGLVCQIAQTPVQNKISIAFHENFGFKLIGNNPFNEIMYGIYLKQL